MKDNRIFICIFAWFRWDVQRLISWKLKSPHRLLSFTL